jgi:hypothetical protein
MSAAVPTTDPGPNLECPPSLRRLAPASVAILDERRRPSSIFSGGVLLMAHCRYQIRIVTSTADTDYSAVPASLAPDEHVRPIGATQVQILGNGQKEYVLRILTSRVFRPWPIRSRVSITLNHTRWGNYSHEIPVTIWPGPLVILLWALGCVAAPIWPPYLAGICLDEGHLRPVPEIVGKLQGSSELFLVTLVVTALLWLAVYGLNLGYQVVFQGESP